MKEETKSTNHLINEKSPYLLQHAHNPVNWFPWGQEAFDTAKSEDKPIFLSIGYSTCHWCHVMERESFEDLEAAEALNRNFISIKVDREERPDVDAVYMTVCQALTGAGGWPLTIVMTPDKKPFYAGTYLPKHARYGSMGLLELLAEITSRWKQSREELLDSGEKITEYLNKSSDQTNGSAEPKRELLKEAVSGYLSNFDRTFGGFGKAPKFPAPHNLLFLMQYYKAQKEKSALMMAEKTLEQMYKGGMFDHIGGGFSRYSTDNRWLVPHFEKMLYDNALLSYAYLDAYKITKRNLFRFVAEKTLRYAINEMRNEAGGFSCAQDADSDGVEGKYYVFSPEEITTQLGKEDGDLFCRQFDITETGNFEGKNIPNLLQNSHFEEQSPKIEQLCKKIVDLRQNRTNLLKDDKVLTSWNALMIVALAKAARETNNAEYITIAEKTHQFIKENLIDSNGRLLVRWRMGYSAQEGFLDDYAFFTWALLELYATTYEVSYLTEAIRFATDMVFLFFDAENGGFYLYANNSESLLFRPKEIYDGAMPSGNSTAALVLLRLARITGNLYWQNLSEKQLRFLTSNIGNSPAGYGFSLFAMTEVLYPAVDLVCVSSKEQLTKEEIKEIDLLSVWNMTTLIKTAQNEEELAKVAPFTSQYPLEQEGEVFYLCRNGACSAPIKDIKTLKAQLADSLLLI